MLKLFVVLGFVSVASAAVSPGGESLAKYTDDLPGLMKRRVLRALVVQSPVEYQVVKGQQLGVTADLLNELEKDLNQKFSQQVSSKKRLPIRVVIIPTTPDKLQTQLLDGKADVIAFPMTRYTVTNPELRTTEPLYGDAREVVVFQKGAQKITSILGLSGKRIFVRPGSRYEVSLSNLNKELGARGLPPVLIEPLEQHISDDEAIEMVNSGLIPATAIHRYRALNWMKVLNNIQVNTEVFLHDHGKLVWVVRKDSPRLTEYLNGFIATHRMGGLFYNSLLRHYYSRNHLLRVMRHEDGAQFGTLLPKFEKYSSQYGIDHLLLLAQGFQESGLNQMVQSPVGAIGIMQLMPATGKEMKVGDIKEVDPNIHAGAKYLSLLKTKYFSEKSISERDRFYFCFAAYNAGPGAIRRMRKLTLQEGLDPNVWFGNVELVTLKYIGNEPVRYVGNISKYYLAYRFSKKVASR